MKTLYNNISVDKKEFKDHVRSEGLKHGSKSKGSITEKKTKSQYLKDIAKKISLKYCNDKKNILCVGCRDKSELLLFKSNNIDSFGIDPALATEKIKKAPAERILDFFKEDEFDFVYASHSLEHVVIPEKVLLNIRKVSKKGCYVILPVKKQRVVPKKAHPVMFDISLMPKNSKKKDLELSVINDFKLFEPYKIEDIFFIDGYEPEFHICFTWEK